MVRFQMKTSNRPQTIATVRSQIDINSFRTNPEWYEIKEEAPIVSLNEVPKVTRSNGKNKAKETA